MTLSSAVLAQLSAINRQRLALPSRRPPSPSVATSSNLEEATPAEQASSELPNGEPVETTHGAHYRIERPLSTIWPRGAAVLARMEKFEGDGLAETRHQQLRAFLANDAILLDLETCGLGSTTIFLAGLLHVDNGQWRLVQLLARNYSEEKSLLAALVEIVAGKKLLVTYNGKSFDWPCVRDRSTLHRLGGAPSESPHVDLLHLVRRHWGARLPNCRLQTVERIVCGRRRLDDIPGREIPNAYHAFVRTGDARQVRRILHHNALDLITLLQAATLMACDGAS